MWPKSVCLIQEDQELSIQFVWKLLYPLCGQIKVLIFQKLWNNEDIRIDPSFFHFYLKLIALEL